MSLIKDKLKNNFSVFFQIKLRKMGKVGMLKILIHLEKSISELILLEIKIIN